MQDKNIREGLERIDEFGDRVSDGTRRVCGKIASGVRRTGEHLGDFLRGYVTQQTWSTLGPLGEEFGAYLDKNSNSNSNSLGLGVVVGLLTDCVILGGVLNGVISDVLFKTHPDFFVLTNDYPTLNACIYAARNLAIAKAAGLSLGFAYKFGRHSEAKINEEDRKIGAQ